MWGSVAAVAVAVIGATIAEARKQAVSGAALWLWGAAKAAGHWLSSGHSVPGWLLLLLLVSSAVAMLAVVALVFAGMSESHWDYDNDEFQGSAGGGNGRARPTGMRTLSAHAATTRCGRRVRAQRFQSRPTGAEHQVLLRQLRVQRDGRGHLSGTSNSVSACVSTGSYGPKSGRKCMRGGKRKKPTDATDGGRQAPAVASRK